MITMRRPLGRNVTTWHPHVSATHYGQVIRGGALTIAPLYGPAGLVGPVGATDHPYQGMDPSDPVSWVRPYNPQPGMMRRFNYDGASPNNNQTFIGTGDLSYPPGRKGTIQGRWSKW